MVSGRDIGLVKRLTSIRPITTLLLVSQTNNYVLHILTYHEDIAEETKNAAVAVPAAIVNGVVLTAILGFFVNVSLCYGIRDLSALPGPTGLVFAQVCVH